VAWRFFLSVCSIRLVAQLLFLGKMESFAWVFGGLPWVVMAPESVL
jgi:hypothetical protein